jgi:hypothetical protein
MLKKRTNILLKLHIELERQKQELTQLLNKKTLQENIFILNDDESEDIKPQEKDIKKRYGNFYIYFYPQTKMMKSFEVNQKAVDKDKLLAGFIANVTNNLNFTPLEALHHYKLQNEQEKYFEQMNDQMGADCLEC